MKKNKLRKCWSIGVQCLFILSILTSCSSNSSDNDVTELSEIKKQAIEKIDHATNLDQNQKKRFKEDVKNVQDELVVNVLKEVNSQLPLSLKDLKFTTIQKEELIDGKSTGWKNIKDLEGDQETIFEFISNTALRGKFYIDASRIADYKNTYDIVIGDKYVYNRSEKTVMMTISSLKFTYSIKEYDHEQGEIFLHFINYNNGKDFPPGIPYYYEGAFKDRYLQNIYTLRMKVIK